MSMAILSLILMLVSFTTSEATDFLVGGKDDSWRVPTSSSEFNKWAQKNRFKVGDYLVWEHVAKNDAVLEVTKHGYETCNTSDPIKGYHDDNVRVKLDRSGPFFFISGADGHCKKGEKLDVVVLSEDHGGDGEAVISPSPSEPPAPATRSGSSGRLRADGVVFVGLFVVVGSFVGHVLAW